MASTDVPRSLVHLVWIDPDLAGPAAVTAGALELARAFARFQVSDAITIAQVSSTAIQYQEGLSAIAASVRLYHVAEEHEGKLDRYLGRASDLELRLAALERLTIELANRLTRDGGALWLLVDGWPLEIDEITALQRTPRGGSEPTSVSTVIERTSRLLSAFGWTTYPVGAQRELATEAYGTVSRPHENSETGEELARQSPIAEREWKGEWWYRIFTRRKRRQEAIPVKNRIRALDAALDPRLQPLSVLASPTSDALVAEQYGIEDHAFRMRNRRRIVIREPETPPGPLRRLEVVWIGGDGRTLATPRWVRFGAPPELALARLHALAAGQLAADSGRVVRLHLRDSAEREPELCFVYENRKSETWLRVSTWSDADAIALIGKPLEVPEDARLCAPIPGISPQSGVLLLEDLITGDWGVQIEQTPNQPSPGRQ
jgi:hypothetical protein